DTAFFDKKSKFLHYRPQVAIITSVELDHVDIFDGLDAIKASFREFVGLLPPDGVLLCGADSPGALEWAQAARCKVEGYGSATIADGQPPALEWRAVVTGTRPGGRTVFEVQHNGEAFGTFDTGLPGAYNLDNTLAVIAVLHHQGLSVPEIARGVRLFA